MYCIVDDVINIYVTIEITENTWIFRTHVNNMYLVPSPAK